MTTKSPLSIIQAKVDTVLALFNKHDAHEWLLPHFIDSSPLPPSVYALCQPAWREMPFKPSETTLKALAAFGKDGWKLASVEDGWQCCNKLVDGVLVELHQAYPVAILEEEEPQLVDPALLMGGAV